ncbi:hypothetical protein ACJMK2_024489 [Sinanodonta woodiana]|uniref:Sodefrin-like factor n=1 Tax=Sinanodonta woodiana TaxID=1069815 RepID=A0ABD3XDJ3_SINWO
MNLVRYSLYFLLVQSTAIKTTPVTTNVTLRHSISCFECTDDPSGCEYNYQPVTCSSPNNYCINALTNNGDASRVIIRRCGNYDECVHDWWDTYSDNELCKNFNQDTPYNMAFDCKFCCVKDACNEKINPPKETNFIKT